MKKLAYDADKLLTNLIELGRDLISAGAEVWLVEERLSDIFEAYGFKESNILIMGEHIEITVLTPERKAYTQMREVKGRESNMEKLRVLSRLSGHILEETPSPEVIEEKLGNVDSKKYYPKWVMFMGAAFGTANFAMYFNGWRQDVIMVGFVTLLILIIKDRLVKTEDNPLILNTMLAYIMEVLLIASLMLGITRSLTSMTAGVILLMISGLGLTTGMRDLLHKNVMSGLSDFVHALLGAMGIAIGISLALMTFREEIAQQVQGQMVVLSPVVQGIASISGSVGFAIASNCRKRVLIASAFGSALTYSTFRIVNYLTDGQYFEATLAGAAVAAIFANVVAIFIKAPPSVFLNTCICPLLPGGSFYKVVYAIIMDDNAGFSSNGRAVFLVCIAIALGYIIVEVLFKYTKEFRLGGKH